MPCTLSYICQSIFRWLSNQRSYLTNGGFEKKLNIRIYDAMNGHRLFDMYQMINDFGCMLEYDVLNMFLRFKEKYTLKEGYHGVI